MRFFGAQLSGGGAKLVFLKNKNGQKRVPKIKFVHLFFGAVKVYFIVAG